MSGWVEMLEGEYRDLLKLKQPYEPAPLRAEAEADRDDEWDDIGEKKCEASTAAWRDKEEDMCWCKEDVQKIRNCCAVYGAPSMFQAV